MFKKLSYLFFCLIAATLFLKAQTAEEIINKSIAAVGGTEKYQNLKSIFVNAEVNSMGFTIPISITQKGKSFYIEQSIMGQVMKIGYDGTEGWMVNPMGGSSEPQKMDEAQLEQFKQQNDITKNPVLKFKEEGNKFELMGIEKVDDVKAYKIKTTNKDNEERILFINSSNYLPIKLVTERGEEQGEVLIKDYKDIGGIMMFHLIEVKSQGQDISFKFNEIKLNPEVDDKIFKMPSK
ncbi:MAG: outer membrane lipoprotein-sorting protein [Candidatus Kapabacteria bacterium]|nr:outer membrane lipoprotein-sorting protein [Candidatus Kapabacteria bacterium]